MKRFTGTEKWAKGWFRQLKPRLKCLWQYLCENSDCAGVWEPDFELASFQIGEQVAEADLAAFGDRIAKLPSGKFFLTTFIEFQYGKLSEGCKAHIPIYRAIAKHRLSIGYPKAMHSLQEEETEKEKEKDAEGVQGEPRRPAGLMAPRDLAEVIAFAKTIKPTSDIRSLPDDGFCGWFYDEHEKRGWIDGHSKTPIRDWRAALRAAWRSQLHNRLNASKGYAPQPRVKPGAQEQF